jgi:mannose/cellobiose epimerase-like protein (N-acyl-D-glucosamine 2-epimerase family)
VLSVVANAPIEPNPNLTRLPRDAFNPESPINAISQFRYRHRDHALDGGWDDENGGFYDKGDSFAGPAFDTTKVWWTQAEGLNALLVMDKNYGGKTDRYARAFQKQWDFIRAHMIDPVHGGWFPETQRDGTLHGDGAKANPWKANYHTSRAMMNVVNLLTMPGHKP